MDFKTCKLLDVRERCEKALEKAKLLQESLNAVVTFVDIEEQLEALKDIDENAPMYGMPIVLKDNVTTKGIKTTASSKILDNYIPVFNATIVDKLKAAGAIVIAKASMDELAMGGTNRNAYTGKVNNAWDQKRISGGSSGGSAVLVASGCVPFAIGSDTGDSIRKPACYNGVIGVKPTYGRISRYGVLPYASSLDHVGYFTTNVEDACLGLEVLAGRDDRDMTSSYLAVTNYKEALNADLTGKKIAVLENIQEEITDATIRENFNHLCDELVKRGAIVDRVRMNDQLLNAILPVYYLIANAEATANHSNLDGIRFGVREDGESVEEVMTNSRTKGLGSYVRKRFVIGSYTLTAENQEKLFRKAQRVRRLIVDDFNRILKDYDVILASASSDIAPLSESSCDRALVNENKVAENYMVLGNFSGCPSMSLPTGLKDGMPIGINLHAKLFDEQTMFNVAKAIEEIVDFKGLEGEVK